MAGRKAAGANEKALAVTLRAFRELGRLELVDDALVALCRSTARALDSHPERATLVKEYRECLVLLSGLGHDGDVDAYGALLAELSGAEVGDSAED